MQPACTIAAEHWLVERCDDGHRLMSIGNMDWVGILNGGCIHS